MRTSIHLLVALCFYCAVGLAQQSVELLDFSPEVYRDGNLFKGIILQPANNTEVLEITLSLNGQLIATQQGSLAPGSQNLSDANILSSVFTPPYKELLQLGLLPEGRYSLCVRSQGETKPVCKSYRHIVRPGPFCVSLVYPADQTELESPYPTLVWTSTLMNVPGMAFEPSVTQSPKSQRREVTHFSMPDHFATRTFDNALPYPLTAAELREGEEYQWNVDLTLNGQLVCRSDVWRFHIGMDSLNTKLPINLSYIDLNQVDDMAAFFVLGELKLYLPTNAGSQKVSILILDERGKEIKLKQDQLVFNKSNNYLLYDLAKNGNLKHLKPYQVELTTPKGKLRLVITYVNPDLYAPPAAH